MYSWMVYLHVLATLSFLTVHGVSSVVAWRLRASATRRRLAPGWRSMPMAQSSGCSTARCLSC
jgi:hypothetical protein